MHSIALLSQSFEACAVRNFASIVSEACGLVPLKQKVAHIATGTYPGALVNILSSKAERKTGVHVFNFEWALRDLNIHLVEEKQHSLTGNNYLHIILSTISPVSSLCIIYVCTTTLFMANRAISRWESDPQNTSHAADKDCKAAN